jgi:hypothetical protein
MHSEKLHSAAPNLSFLLGLRVDPEANNYRAGLHRRPKAHY